MTDKQRDPAMLRFWLINATRVLGTAFIIVGMLIANHRILLQLPVWVGWISILIGVLGVFVLPVTMVRKWRTPK